MTGDEEARARHIERIRRRYCLRQRKEGPSAEREPDRHALAWGRIARALETGRRPTGEDVLAAGAADPSFPEIFRAYVHDLLIGDVKATRGVKPGSGSVERALEEYRRFLTEKEAPKPRRLPSVNDLLGVVAANAGVPERVRLHIQQLRDGKVKATRGRRPRRYVQYTRDIILVEVFQALLQELRRDPEWRKPNIYDAIGEFARRHWGATEAWRAMATTRDSRRPWTSRLAEVRYFRAEARLDALRATDGEGRPVYRQPE